MIFFREELSLIRKVKDYQMATYVTRPISAYEYDPISISDPMLKTKGEINS